MKVPALEKQSCFSVITFHVGLTFQYKPRMVFQQEALLEQTFPIGHHPISDQGKTYVSKKII